MKKIFAMLLLLVVGCVPNITGDTIAQAQKGLLVAKGTVVTVAISADALCSHGILKQEQCTKIGQAYLAANNAYIVAVDAVNLAAKFQTAENWQDFLKKQELFTELVNDLALLQQEVK